mmetsp:Transcript_23242/g.42396  ORF Transcript_23242/g.42396 Transcript_23242/m.42396 type:complete len:669 (-) Transcript_23242:78-2084(-)
MLTGLRVLHARFSLLAWLLRSYAAAAHSKALIRRDGLDTVRRHASIDTYHTPPPVDLDLEEDKWFDYDVGDIDFLGNGSNDSAPAPPPPPSGDDDDANEDDDEVVLSNRMVDWVAANCSVVGNALVPTFSDTNMNCAAYHAKGKPVDKLNAAKAEYYDYVVNSTGDMLSGLCFGNFSGSLGEILYGIRTSGSEVYVYKLGAQVNSNGADGRYEAGDSFRIQLANDKVNYYHKGKMLYSTAVTTDSDLIPCVTFCSVSRLEDAQVAHPPTTTTTFTTTTTTSTTTTIQSTTTTVTMRSLGIQWHMLDGQECNDTDKNTGKLTCTDNSTANCFTKSGSAISDASQGLGDYNTWTIFEFTVGSDQPIATGLCKRASYAGGYASMDFAMSLAGADDGMAVFIFESGVLIDAGSAQPNASAWDVYANDDLFEMAIVNGHVTYRHNQETMYTSDKYTEGGLYPCVSFCGLSSLGSAAITWGTTTTSTTTIPFVKPVTWDVLTNIAVKPSSGLLGDRAEVCWAGGARADSQDTLSLNAGEGEFNTFQFSVNISGGAVIAGLCPLNYTTGRTFVRHAFFLVAGTVFIWDSNGLVRAHSLLSNSSSWDLFGTGDIFEVILMEGNVSYKFINTVLYTHTLGNVSKLTSSDWPLVPCATMCSFGHLVAPKIRKKGTIGE